MGESTVLFAGGPLLEAPVAEGVFPEADVDRLTEDVTALDDPVAEELPIGTADAARVIDIGYVVAMS